MKLRIQALVTLSFGLVQQNFNGSSRVELARADPNVTQRPLLLSQKTAFISNLVHLIHSCPTTAVRHTPPCNQARPQDHLANKSNIKKPWNKAKWPGLSLLYVQQQQATLPQTRARLIIVAVFLDVGAGGAVGRGRGRVPRACWRVARTLGTRRGVSRRSWRVLRGSRGICG